MLLIGGCGPRPALLHELGQRPLARLAAGQPLKLDQPADVPVQDPSFGSCTPRRPKVSKSASAEGFSSILVHSGRQDGY
jgi:hypothetical protein